MKRGAKLGVLLGALAVLVGAWLLAESLSGRREEALAREAHADPIDISVGESGDVTAISWNYFGDTVSLRYDADAAVWRNADDEACPINSEAVEALVDAVASAQADDAIEDVTDFDQYGLADPAIVVMAATEDNIVTYNVGDPTAAGTYYVRLDGGDTVYTETGALARAFQTTLDDLLDLESVPHDIDTVTALTVTTDAGDYALERLEDPGAVWYTDTWPWFLLDADGAPRRPLDTDRVEELYGLVTDVTFLDCATWNGGDGFGMDAPQGTVTVDYRNNDGEGGAFTLEFGDYLSDGQVYVRLAGSQLIYRVSGSILDGLMYPDFDAMAPLAPTALNWDGLKGIHLALEEGEYDILRTRSTPMEEGEEPEDIYTEGDRSLDAETVKTWLRQVYELPADSRAEDGVGRAEVFSLSFDQENAAYPRVTVVFRSYDSAHYLCTVNDQESYFVPRSSAESLARNAAGLLKQEASPSPSPAP